MKTLFNVASAALLVSSLSGCSIFGGEEGWFPDPSKDYQNSKVLADLTIPEGIQEPPRNNIFTLPPPVNGKVAEGDLVMRPKPLLSDDEAEFVRVQALDGEAWVVVKLSTGEVWPRVRYFFESNRLPLQQVDGREGVLETNWLTSPSLEEFYERYRVSIRQGVQPSTAEVHVVQRSVARDKAESVLVDWDGASDDAQRERWMVMEIANYLAQNNDQQSISLLAQGMGEASRVRLITDQGPAYIELELPMTRAWAAMPVALKKAQFALDDRNQSEGVYYVTYDPAVKEEDKPGFWGSLFGAEPERSPYADKRFILRLKSVDKNRVQITLEADDAMPELDRQELLDLIKVNIS